MKLSVFFLALVFALQSYAALKINGAGATFPYPIYSKWFAEYQKTNKEVEFNYQSIGSGGGIKQVLKQTVDFGASDAPMTDEELKEAAWPIQHIPTVLGAVSIAFNLKDVTSLNLSAQTVSAIFMGKITKWNDPLILKDNPTAKLPAKDILVVRRSDGSGTTAVFTDYLANVSKEWKDSVGAGKTVNWPVGVGAKGNEGVTGLVKQTEGSLGYIEVAYAITNKIPMAKIKNSSGVFAEPSLANVSASASAIKDFSGDLRMSIVNAAHKDAYPISAFTYILLPKPAKDSNQLVEVKKFLNWALTTGQDMAPGLHYAPLPKELTKALLLKIK
jgi:phosphate transport system substrate-binding protein